MTRGLIFLALFLMAIPSFAKGAKAAKAAKVDVCSESKVITKYQILKKIQPGITDYRAFEEVLRNYIFLYEEAKKAKKSVPQKCFVDRTHLVKLQLRIAALTVEDTKFRLTTATRNLAGLKKRGDITKMSDDLKIPILAAQARVRHLENHYKEAVQDYENAKREEK